MSEYASEEVYTDDGLDRFGNQGGWKMGGIWHIILNPPLGQNNERQGQVVKMYRGLTKDQAQEYLDELCFTLHGMSFGDYLADLKAGDKVHAQMQREQSVSQSS